MNKQKITIFASAIAALAISGTSGATVISYGGTLDGHGVPTSDVAGATVIDFNSGDCAPASCSGTAGINYAIVTGTTPSHNGEPGNSSFHDKTQYLTVPNKLTRGDSKSTTISLGSGNHYFGLLWGSIDSYNKLTFLFDDKKTPNESYSGSKLLKLLPATTSNGTHPTRYVNFFQLPAFKAVTLYSSSYAFESDNLAYSDVPEPGNLVLFGLGALALLLGFRGRFSGRAS